MTANSALARVLSLDSLVPYLLDRQLLASRDVVDAPLEIRDYSRRNRSFKVIAPGRESLLVKQSGALSDPEYVASIASEAAILRAIEVDPVLAGLRPYTPRFVAFDVASSVLVTELLHPATSVTKYHLNRGAVHFPEDSAISCARILADVHVLGRKAIASGSLPELPLRTPFIWDSFTSPEQLSRAGPGVHRLAQMVRERATFLDRLPEMRRAWGDAQGLVHLDLRWDNFLLTHGAGPRGMLNLRLIDWEMAGRGDPAWDVACFLSEYVRFHLQQAGTTPIEEGHASARAFLSAYVARAKVKARAELLRRVGDHLPFALLLIATEIVQSSDVVKPASRAAFELALAAAEDPRAVMATSIGVDT